MDGAAARRTPSDPAVREADALQVAAEASAARRSALWSPRPLTPLVRALLWSLRIYVVLMLAVVVVQLTRLGR